MRVRRRLLAVAVALLAGGCNQILGIHPGILDPGDAAAPDGGADAGDATVAPDEGPAADGASDRGLEEDAAVACLGKCGDPDCGVCPTTTMVQIGSSGGYEIDATEVTNQAYSDFLAANPATANQATHCLWNNTFEPYPPIIPAKATHPVTGVDWCDAFAYCVWARKRLCGQVGGAALPFDNYAGNTSQWYRACKPTLGPYPYGLTYGANVCNGEDHLVGTTVPAGSMSSCVGSVPGLHDMSGNVAEWEDSCGSETGMTDVCHVRGGSFESAAVSLQCDANATKNRSAQHAAVGFRCCRD